MNAVFQGRKDCELKKAEVAAQILIVKCAGKKKDVEHKKELGRLKEFWNVLTTTNQHHAKWGKHVIILKKY